MAAQAASDSGAPTTLTGPRPWSGSTTGRSASYRAADTTRWDTTSGLSCWARATASRSGWTTGSPSDRSSRAQRHKRAAIATSWSGSRGRIGPSCRPFWRRSATAARALAPVRTLVGRFAWRWRPTGLIANTVQSVSRRSDDATCRCAHLLGRLRGARLGIPDASRTSACRDPRGWAAGNRAGASRVSPHAARQAVARLLEEAGLELAAGFVSPVLHRPELKDRAIYELTQVASAVAGAGGHVLIVAAAAGSGYDARQTLDQPGWSALLAGLRRAQEIADHHDLELAFHPHAGTVVESAEAVGRLLELSDVGLCLDTGHLLIGGVDPVHLAATAGSRVRHVHLKDVEGLLASR